MGYKDSKQVAGSCVVQQECHEEVCKKTPPSMATGACDYYKNRHENYIQRHQHDSKSGGDTPPSYYLDYGFKYCTKFSEETMPKLSSNGKTWLKDTLQNLQEFMEAGVVQKSWRANINTTFNTTYLSQGTEAFYTGIECRDNDFTAFAFATHPDAYNPQMFKTLTCDDLITIGFTPSDEYKPSGKHKLDTIAQIGFVAKELWNQGDISTISANCAKEAGGYMARKLDEIGDTIVDGFEDFINTVSRGGI